MSHLDGWELKEEWRRRSADFCVTVTRHVAEPHDGCGIHRWCVYVYCYTEHHLFSDWVRRESMGDFGDTPLNWYASFRRIWTNEAGEPASVQVGADYNHLGDDEMTHVERAEDAGRVFRDAARLFDWMTAQAAPPKDGG